jgi:hypothetical protein
MNTKSASSALTVAACIFCTVLVMRPTVVSGASMMPTLHDKDVLITTFSEMKPGPNLNLPEDELARPAWTHRPGCLRRATSGRVAGSHDIARIRSCSRRISGGIRCLLAVPGSRRGAAELQRAL